MNGHSLTHSHKIHIQRKKYIYVSVIWRSLASEDTHTQDTHGFFCSIALMHLERKIISLWGGGPEDRKLGP